MTNILEFINAHFIIASALGIALITFILTFVKKVNELKQELLEKRVKRHPIIGVVPGVILKVPDEVVECANLKLAKRISYYSTVVVRNLSIKLHDKVDWIVVDTENICKNAISSRDEERLKQIYQDFYGIKHG